ncbi:MAG: polynucleotide adenylyltransferase PcnB [Kiritimatiellae bacterium]|nr:polynucleotide adenylyltransferase PcnB [Kiritimatiellia bacterium]
MFSFLKRKSSKPVIYTRQEHGISRKNIDPDALKVLYRLSSLGYTAYLVGGGVRDLLLGRQPKDFDVGTSANPNEVRHAFKNCFLIGRRFRLAHIRFGHKVIETATFRQNSQTVGEIIEHAAEGPLEDNTFGTPETDAYRRDFTVNGLFYNIKDFSVIDWVGGMEDLKRGIIRAIGEPGIRFQEDPVRMMRAMKFSARLGFKIERKTWNAMKKYHSCILTASVPRVCEEVFRLFSFSSSREAFKLMWRSGMMKDLLPGLAYAVDAGGGEKSVLWKLLGVLDDFDKIMSERGWEVPNAIRAAVLMTPVAEDSGRPGCGRKAMQQMLSSLKIPKATYFTAALLIESARRLAEAPAKGKSRFVHNRDFMNALDYNRIVTRALGKSEKNLDAWADLYESVSRKQVQQDDKKGTVK